jgi:hypothetical protein
MNCSWFRRVARLKFAVLVVLALMPLAVVAAPVLSARYDPADGNITLVGIDDVTSQPVALSIATFQFLSPLQYLSGTAAAVPASAVSFATILNTDESTFFDPARTGAEIYVTNFGGSTPLFTGSWNLGNVATTGLSPTQLVSGFTTDPDVSPGDAPLPGKFLYQVQGNPTFFAGEITSVPEPSAVGIAVAAGLTAAVLWRRRARGA